MSEEVTIPLQEETTPKGNKNAKRKGGAPKGNKNAVGNDGGRPTKFEPEFAQALIAFFSIEPTEEYTYEFSREFWKDGTLKKESTKKKPLPAKMPTLFGFARSIKVDYSTVLDWSKKGDEMHDDKGPKELIGTPKHPEFVEFSRSYKEAKELQKEFLIRVGLMGAAPSAAFIFTAKNVTDMRDKVETDLTSKGEQLGVVFLPQKSHAQLEEKVHD